MDYGINSIFGYGAYGMNPFQSTNKNAVSAISRVGQYTGNSDLQAIFKSSSTQLNTLKSDSSNFLNQYTASLKTMSQSAEKVQGKNLDRLIGDISSGEISDENLKKVVDATQSMVDAYNSTLTLLNKNADRGSGVTEQIGRMAASPAPDKVMDLIGLSVKKDGTLALDTEKFSKKLKDSVTSDKATGTNNQLKLFKDILGGSTGIAGGIQKDAVAGANMSTGKLIGNDLAEMQNIKASSPFAGASMYSRSGVYTAMNAGVVGMMMNIVT